MAHRDSDKESLTWPSIVHYDIAVKTEHLTGPIAELSGAQVGVCGRAENRAYGIVHFTGRFPPNSVSRNDTYHISKCKADILAEDGLLALGWVETCEVSIEFVDKDPLGRKAISTVAGVDSVSVFVHVMSRNA
jgi:hypothetical protein